MIVIVIGHRRLKSVLMDMILGFLYSKFRKLLWLFHLKIHISLSELKIGPFSRGFYSVTQLMITISKVVMLIWNSGEDSLCGHFCQAISLITTVNQQSRTKCSAFYRPPSLEIRAVLLKLERARMISAGNTRTCRFQSGGSWRGAWILLLTSSYTMLMLLVPGPHLA